MYKLSDIYRNLNELSLNNKKCKKYHIIKVSCLKLKIRDLFLLGT